VCALAGRVHVAGQSAVSVMIGITIGIDISMSARSPAASSGSTTTAPAMPGGITP
jgi:hypothetical protein